MRIYHLHFRNDIPIEHCVSLLDSHSVLHGKEDGSEKLRSIISKVSEEIKNGRKIYHFYKINIFDIGKNPFIVFCKEDDIENIANTLCQLKRKNYNPFENYSFIKEHMYDYTNLDISDKTIREYCLCNDRFVAEDEDINTTDFLYKNIRLHKNFFIADEEWFGFFYTKRRFTAVVDCLAYDIGSKTIQ